VQVDARRAFLGAVVVSLVLTAAIAIVTVLLGDFGETEARILLTTASISFYSLLALPGSILLERQRMQPLALTSLGLAALGFLLALNMIWIQWDDAGDGSWKSHVVVTIVALATTQAAGVELRRRDADSIWARRLAFASHASAALAALLASLAVLWEVEDDGFLRALGAVVVANVLLVTLQPVLRRMGGAPAARYSFVCVLDGGRRVDVERPGRDFAAALERAVRELERSGERVVGIERT
jgi:hypothetical protein